LDGILSLEDKKHLCDLEFYDWLSGLYWGEGIAMNYALKMSEISPNKEKWLQVYRDEHKHQTLLSNWFIERGLTPLPRNKFIDYAFKMVDGLDSTKSEKEIIDTIYSTQVFYEELFHFLLKFRLKYIKDRDLKAIFYQIFIDESEHLSKARAEIIEMNEKPKKLYETLEENIKHLFPLGIAKAFLRQEQLVAVKEIQDVIVIETIEEAKTNNHLYRPIQILHKFQRIPEYNCYACSPSRHDGLHLEPIFNTDLNIVEDSYVFPKRCEGFNSVVHGGFIGMVLDEMMCYSSILSLNLLPLTSSMTVSFKQPIMVGQTYKLEATVIEQAGQIITSRAYIKDSNGRVCAESEGKLYVPTKSQAPKILGKLGNHEALQGMFV
jgi:hypothetical protein